MFMKKDGTRVAAAFAFLLTCSAAAQLYQVVPIELPPWQSIGLADMNDADEVVGNFYSAATGLPKAFAWDGATRTTHVLGESSANYTAFGISAAGVIVGSKGGTTGINSPVAWMNYRQSAVPLDLQDTDPRR